MLNVVGCLGQREFVSMLPLVCNEAVALLFMFDLSRKSTLSSIKEWYRQARGFNKVSVALRRALCRPPWPLCVLNNTNNADCDTVFDWHEIRSVCESIAGGADADYEARSQVRKGNAVAVDLLLDARRHFGAENFQSHTGKSFRPKLHQYVCFSTRRFCFVLNCALWFVCCAVKQISNIGEPILEYWINVSK